MDDDATSGNERAGWVPSIARVASYVVLLGVVPLILGTLTAFAFAATTVFRLLVSVGSTPPGNAAVQLAKAIDLVLIGVVLFVVAAGLAELFAPPLFRARLTWLPRWLAVESLDDLKNPLLSTLVLIIAVGFVDEVAGGTNAVDALGLGVGSAAVIAAIALYLRLAGH
jgi:uncharacterized membrane protein YqhA